MTASPSFAGTPGLPRRGLFLGILLVFAATGCGTTSSSSKGSWQQPRAHQGPYQAVLVVAISQDSRVRRSFEQQLAESITAGGSRGVAAYQVGERTGVETLSRDNVLAMARTSGADAILITRVMSTGARPGESQEGVEVDLGPSVQVYQDSDMTAVISTPYTIKQEPGSPIIVANAVLQSSLYDPASGDRLVYQATTQAKFDIGPDDSIEDDAGDLAVAVAKQLRSDSVIR